MNAEKRGFENQQLATSNWQLTKASLDFHAARKTQRNQNH
jgi:hypothetical protein